ncbi:MAG: hypothetical protein GY765_24540 [bacterium]|nr:hypothetical protein [bacterium]
MQIPAYLVPGKREKNVTLLRRLCRSLYGKSACGCGISLKVRILTNFKIFRSDRPTSINRIKEIGPAAFADEMAEKHAIVIRK